jgi:hypothetical protein
MSWLKTFISINFLKKFSFNLLIGLSLFIILAGILNSSFSSILKRGPVTALAQEWYEGSWTGSDDNSWENTQTDLYGSSQEPTTDWWNGPTIDQQSTPLNGPLEDNYPFYDGSWTSSQDNQWENTQTDLYGSSQEPTSNWWDNQPFYDGSTTGANDDQWENTQTDLYGSSQEPTTDWWNQPPLDNTQTDLYGSSQEPTTNWWETAEQQAPQAGPQPVYHTDNSPVYNSSPSQTASAPFRENRCIGYNLVSPSGAVIERNTPSCNYVAPYGGSTQGTSQSTRYADSQPLTQAPRENRCVGYNLVSPGGAIVERNTPACNYVAPYAERAVYQAPATGGPAQAQAQSDQSQSTSSNASSSSTSSSQGGNATINLTNNVTNPSTETTNPATPLSVNCTATTTPGTRTITWSAFPQGGVQPYSFRWIGGNAAQDTTNPNGQTIVVNHRGIGQQTGEVEVRDAQGRTAFNTCHGFIDSAAVVTPAPSSTTSTTTTTTTAAAQPTCPPNTVEKSRSTTQLVCEAQTATTTTTTSPTQVVTTTEQATAPVKVLTQADTASKELPKTGFPLVAWGIASLIPGGLRLRKLTKKGDQSASDLTANSIWMERQLQK